MQYRRIRSDEPAPVLATVLVGLGLGLAAGFILGELFAGQGRRGLARALTPWKNRPGPKPTPAQIADQLERSLGQVLGPDADTLDLVPVGRNAIELHGWVASRGARVRALKAAREAIGPETRLVDRLLVWGEDDLPAPEPSGPAPASMAVSESMAESD